jgi:restriction system protein
VARSLASQIVAAHAESQRRAERARIAQERQWRAMQQEQVRAQRAAQRAQAQHDRAALAAYQRACENDAAARTGQLAETFAELEQILASGLAAGPFRLDRCKTVFAPPPFNPGPLGEPVPPPDPRRYQVAPPTGLLAKAGKGRQEYEAAVAHAQGAYEQHCREAAAMEQERRRKLAAYYGEFQQWVQREQQRTASQNQDIDGLARRYATGIAEAVLQYFTVALNVSAWPGSFPRRSRSAWDASSRQLVIDWQLPGFEAVPALTRYRYVRASDREVEVARPAGERKAAYRRLVARCALRVVAELFRADAAGHLDSVVFNGYVRAVDPATGIPADFYVACLTVGRAAFSGVNLALADPISCMENLQGRLSAKPEQPVPVQPGRRPESVGGALDGEGAAGDLDLLAMDPIAFEDLVALLFRRRGLDVMTTARSGDEGVDVVAVDPDPVRGGKIVIQVKRYKSTIPPAVVRELYGTVVAQGATKGILVTTAGFGPGSREFAANKPLGLVDGPELLRLLREQDIPARIGGQAPAITAMV